MKIAEQEVLQASVWCPQYFDTSQTKKAGGRGMAYLCIPVAIGLGDLT
jgi:hypothetical protein